MRLALLSALLCACQPDDPWAAYARAAEQVRELELLRDVHVTYMSPHDYFLWTFVAMAGIPEEDLAYFADTYGRLGFFGPETDLRLALAGSASEWAGAAYDHEEEQVILIGPTPPSSLVHEFVHALQDQHFGLADHEDVATSDQYLTRRAAVEGDAVIAEYRYIMQSKHEADLDAIDWEYLLTSWEDYTADLVATSGYPAIFMDYPSFAYAYGLAFTARNLLGVTAADPSPAPAPHDWSQEDDLFTTRVPDSTQRILLRDVELTGADPVVEVGLAEIPPDLADRVTALDWDTLGEWYVYLLLYPLDRDGRVDGRAVAAAWDGDRALFVEDAQNGEIGVLWASAWDDEVHARALESALWSLYGRTTDEALSPNAAWADDGDLVWIEQRGTTLVVAKNIAEDVVEPLVAASFPGTRSAPPRRHPSLPAMLGRWRQPRHPCP